MIDQFGLLARAVTLVAFTACGCAAGYEKQAHTSLDSVKFYSGSSADGEPKHDVKLDGRLEGYIAYAMQRSPTLRASFERWRASVHRIATQRQLPEPTVSYGLFVRSVETRVGPQRHRFSLRQMLPWPSKLTTAADSVASEARAAEQIFRAHALYVRRQVAAVYWQLWLLERKRVIQSKQQELLQALSAAVRSRVEIGKASLAALSQVNLSVSRLADKLRSLDARKRMARARLIDAIGAPGELETPIRTSQPGEGLPTENTAELKRLSMRHPSVTSYKHKATADLNRARHAKTAGLPNFVLGLDYIETGAAAMPGVTDSGKDPVILSVGISLPIWRSSYGGKAAAATARAASWRASGRAARNKAFADLTATMAKLKDADRRINTYRKTLIPQAETVYGAVAGTFQTGASSLASVLIAERDLLNLRLGLATARAEHASAWAALEQVVGRALKAKAKEQP